MTSPTSTRINLFAETPVLSADGFAPKPAPALRVPKAEIEAIATATGFVSSQAPAKKSSQRRHTTGRVIQMNLKATPDFARRFNDLAGRIGLPLVEVFELAIEALEKEQE